MKIEVNIKEVGEIIRKNVAFTWPNCVQKMVPQQIILEQEKAPEKQ